MSHPATLTEDSADRGEASPSESGFRTLPRPQRAVFESAIDGWLVVLLLLAPSIATVAGVWLVAAGRPGEGSELFLAAGVILLVTAAVTLPCRYTLLEDALSIRCGLICYQIPLHEITDVRPSRSLRSGPALSIRRVAVRTERRTVLVSPRDRDRFVEQLTVAAEAARRHRPRSADDRRETA